MDNLYKELVSLFNDELQHLNIGYMLDIQKLTKMTSILNVIEYLKHTQDAAESVNLIKHYEKA